MITYFQTRNEIIDLRGTKNALETQVLSLMQQNAMLLEALEAVFEVFDGDYGHGIANGYWGDYKRIHEQAKQALANGEG